MRTWKAEFPETLFDLFNVQDLGPKRIKKPCMGLSCRLARGSGTGLRRRHPQRNFARVRSQDSGEDSESIAFHQAHASEFRLDQALPRREYSATLRGTSPAVSRGDLWQLSTW